MTVEEKLDAFIKQYNQDSIDSKRQAKRDKYMNLMYIAWGFTLATLSLAVSKINPVANVVNIVATIVFFFAGWILWLVAIIRTK